MYFEDIGTFGFTPVCKNCAVKTHFTGQNRFRIEEGGYDMVKYQYEHQCQDCGALKMADFDDESDTTVFLRERCSCGGQFRRDKPLFCHACKANKTSANKSD